MFLNNNVTLIGMMGSGKSTVGKHLAQSMSFKFLDTDELIEQKQKKSISQIFTDNGEEEFRYIESKTVEGLVFQPLENHIISTGGGIVLNEENVKNFRSIGTIVWLNASSQTILSRIESDSSRPLLASSENETFMEKQMKIEQILKSRTVKYQKAADFIINADHKSVEEISQEIIDCLSLKREL
ncbi:MAG: shikimate kinase [Candidatus Caenarcaniphilales bacterium]|nr:shikimate kinase [Candidatus Caenarcaniphilales bacterium]